MRTIGVRDLKAHLSRVLREVQDGTAVLVTDRGRVVAELRRPDGGPTAESRSERALARLSAAGELRVAERKPGTYRASPMSSPAGTARALLDADRNDR